MGDFKSRIRRLEERSTIGDAGLLAILLRRANGEGSLAAAVSSLERERGRPLEMDPVFRQRVERTWRGVREMASSLFAVTP